MKDTTILKFLGIKLKPAIEKTSSVPFKYVLKKGFAECFIRSMLLSSVRLKK